MKTLQQYEDDFTDAFKVYCIIRDKRTTFNWWSRVFSTSYKKWREDYAVAEIRCIQTNTALNWAVKHLKETT